MKPHNCPYPTGECRCQILDTLPEYEEVIEHAHKTTYSDLLSALEAINDCISYSDLMRCWVLSGNERTLPALNAVRAAIAKAGGRAV